METTKALYDVLWVLKNKYGDIYHDPNTNQIRFFSTRDSAILYKNKCLIEETIKWNPVVYIDDTWIRRERDNFYYGYMLKPIWYDEHWYNKKDGTYCRVDERNRKNVLYVANPEHGMQGIYTPSTPGKYLTKFYESLGPICIQAWANRHKEKFVSSEDLKWANTPDEIEKVYSMDKTFESCMQKPPSYFAPSVHPVRAYGAGDLSVAYLLTSGNRLKARALVWKEKKIVGRIYGDDYALRSALKKEGIETTSDNCSYSSLKGARLLKIKDKQNNFVLPYIDGKPYFADDVDDKYFVLSETSNHARFQCKGTNGYGTEFPVCSICNDRLNTEHIYYNNIYLLNNEGNLINNGSVCHKHKANIKQIQGSNRHYYVFDDTHGIKEDVEYGKYDKNRKNIIWDKYPSVLKDFFPVFISNFDGKQYAQYEMTTIYNSNNQNEYWHSSQLTEDRVFVSEYSGYYFKIDQKQKVSMDYWALYEAKAAAWKGPDNKYYRSEFEYNFIQNIDKHDMFGGKFHSYDFNLPINNAYTWNDYNESWTLKEVYKDWPLCKTLTYNYVPDTKLKSSFYLYIAQKKKEATMKKNKLNDITSYTAVDISVDELDLMF